MKLIACKQGKLDKYDLLRCIRRDGTQASASMPRQGILPHDLIHYVVESALGYRHGFLGLVAAGAAIGPLMVDLHDPAKRAVADEASYAESIVESLQAQLWSGGFDGAAFAAGLAGACASRGRGVPDLGAVDVERELFGGVLVLQRRWLEVPWHGSLELEMAHL